MLRTNLGRQPSTQHERRQMTRTDYLNDPAAPKANRIVPAVSAIVPDDNDRILLILRTDNNYWSIPGGGVKPGESVREATAREVTEETAEVRFVPAEDIPNYKIHPSIRLRIQHYIEGSAAPYIG